MKTNNKVLFMTQAAMIAAIYVVLCLVFEPISYGAIQTRVAGVYADYQQFCCAGECKHRGTVNDRTWKRIFWTTVEICCR